MKKDISNALVVFALFILLLMAFGILFHLITYNPKH